MTSEGVPVDLYIYDLSRGLAAMLSPAIIGEETLFIKNADSDGRQVDGVWHTAVVVYDREFFYGADGITSCAPGSTSLGEPARVERMGNTFVPFQVFLDYVEGLATTTYAGTQYHLFEHNCNSFSEEVAQFLCGAHVPKHILRQPDALPPPLRAALAAMLADLAPSSRQTQAVYAANVRHARADSPSYTTLNNQIEEARAAGAELEARRVTLAEKLARKERRKEKKRRKLQQQGRGDEAEEEEDLDMAEAVEAAAGPAAPVLARAGRSASPDQRELEEARRRARDPPIVYKDIDGCAEFEKLQAALASVTLTEEEARSLEELQQYLVAGEGSWVLGDDFLAFIGRLLHDESLASGVRTAALRCLAAGALRDDASLVLHQDRRHHALLSYAARIEHLPPAEQEAAALFMCNLFEHTSASEWLLYISEWDNNGQPLSNIRVTTKVCVHAALHTEPQMRELGTALMYNITAKEVKTVVFDEICAELAMALLELLKEPPPEEQLHRALCSLRRLAQHSADVPQLIRLAGPDPAAYRGTSERCDEQIDQLVAKL